MNKLKDEVRTMKVCDSVRYKDIYTAFVNNDEETRGLPRTELIEGPKRMLFKQFPGHNLKPDASRIYLSTPLYVPNDKVIGCITEAKGINEFPPSKCLSLLQNACNLVLSVTCFEFRRSKND